MQDEQKINRNSRFLTYALVLVILVGFTAYSAIFRRDEQTVSRLTLNNEGSVTITGSSGTKETVRYDNITSLEFCASPDYGQPLSGAMTNGIREGLWASETFGEYTAYAAESIPCCVFFRTGERAYALNLESADVTRAFYDALDDYLRKNESSP